MSYKWKALLVVCIGSYLTSLDNSIVNIALPRLSQVFHVGPDDVLWVTLGYALVVMGLMMTLGRAGDIFGRKRLYVIGFALFGAGILLNAVSQSFVQVVLARVVQAVGAAMVLANGTAIVTEAFPARERGRGVGISVGIVGLGLMTGPILGGFLLETFGWRATFWPQIPVSAAGSLLAWMLLRSEQPLRQGRGIDYAGAATLFTALGTLVLAINRGEDWGWGSARVAGLLLVSVVSLVLLIIVESRTRNPVLNLSLFRNKAFSTSVISLVIFFNSTAAVVILMPFYFARVLHYGALQTGIALTVAPVVMIVLSPLAGWLSDRLGSRVLATIGMATVVAGLVSLLTLGQSTSMVSSMLRLFVFGVGNALFQTPNSSAIMGAVPHAYLGTAAAINATGRNIGQATGYAIAGAVFVAHAAGNAGVAAGSTLDIDSLPGGAVLAGVRAAIVVTIVIGVLGTAATALTSNQATPDDGELLSSRTLALME